MSNTVLSRKIVGALSVPLAALTLAVALPPPTAAAGQSVVPEAPAWAWCGVHPDDPHAAAAAKAMAEVAGIDATFGPCNVPSAGYTPAFPADRYVDPATYRRLVAINAAAGMKTVVYDARLWSEEQAIRNAALDEWAPLYGSIAAWDLGDEFDPGSSEWPILVARWNTVLAVATARSGIRPYTNFLPTALDQALTDLPGAANLLSFVNYEGDKGAATARRLDALAATLMCGVNAFTHWGFRPDERSIREDMISLRQAGCDQFLVFGGQPAYGSAEFGEESLVDRTGKPTAWAGAVMEGVGRSSFRSVAPARILETRRGPGLVTVDGQYEGVGFRGAGSVTQLTVARRAGVPVYAAAVVLDVTVTNARQAGYVTVYPCDATPPNAAQVNHAAGVTVTTSVIAEVAATGRVCLFTMSDIDLAVDVSGYYPTASPFVAMSPARLLDSRSGPGLATVDGLMLGIGPRRGGVVTELPVARRAGLPSGISAAVLTVTATETSSPGFVTVFPCGGSIPTASTLTYGVGDTVTNTTVVPVSAQGTVCVYSMSTIDLVVDVNGYHGPGATLRPLAPTRIVDTRSGPGLSTVDGRQYGIGRRVADSVLVVDVVGRAGVPATARSVLVSVTVSGASARGFVTVFPCGSSRPNVSTLNVRPGATVSSFAVAQLGARGTFCVYTMTGADVIVDVVGYQA
jgi:hypothetical protein